MAAVPPAGNVAQRAMRRVRDGVVRTVRNNPWETAGLVAGEAAGFLFFGDSFPEKALLMQGLGAAGAMLPRRPAEAAGAIAGMFLGNTIGDFFDRGTSGAFIPLGFADSGMALAGGAAGAYLGNRARETGPGRFVGRLFQPPAEEVLRRELVGTGWNNALAMQVATRYTFHVRRGVPEPISRAAATEARPALQRAGYPADVVNAGETLYIQNRQGGMDPAIAAEKTLLFGGYMNAGVPPPAAREYAEFYARMRGSGLQPAAAQGAADFYRGRRVAGFNPITAAIQARRAYGLRA